MSLLGRQVDRNDGTRLPRVTAGTGVVVRRKEARPRAAARHLLRVWLSVPCTCRGLAGVPSAVLRTQPSVHLRPCLCFGRVNPQRVSVEGFRTGHPPRTSPRNFADVETLRKPRPVDPPAGPRPTCVLALGSRPPAHIRLVCAALPAWVLQCPSPRARSGPLTRGWAPSPRCSDEGPCGHSLQGVRTSAVP